VSQQFVKNEKSIHPDQAVAYGEKSVPVKMHHHIQLHTWEENGRRFKQRNGAPAHQKISKDPPKKRSNSGTCSVILSTT